MLDNKKTKGKHLTIHDRTFIEDAFVCIKLKVPTNLIEKYPV